MRKEGLHGGKFAVWLASQKLPINFAITARVRGVITENQFYQAIANIRLKYQNLAMRVQTEPDGIPELIFDDNLEFPVRFSEKDYPEIWEQTVIEQLVQLFDMQTRPPIQFTLLRGREVSEIIIICPHALADGYSAIYVMRDLLDFLDNPAAGFEPMATTPPLTDLIPNFHGRWMTILLAKIKAALFKLQIRSTSDQDLSPEIQATLSTSNYHLLVWELTAEQTMRLVNRSHEERTTVHAALCTAFLRAFGNLYGNKWNRKIQSPINLRERLTQPVGESFGLYIDLVEFYANCDPEIDFWAVARKIKQEFIQHAGDRPVFSGVLDLVVLMDEVAPIITPEILINQWPKVEYDLSITNLGKLDIPVHYGSLQLEALYGPTITGNPTEIVLGVITIGGKMYFSLVYTDWKLKPSQAEKIKESAMKWLAEAAEW
ncbi:MAG: hypothetical protein AB8I56_10570 [Anaerolineales bacterium]